jgi:excisionase family DNA binding protein
MTVTLLTPDEVAERLAVSPKIVRQWLRDGKLPGIRLGRLWRVNPDALERVLREGFGDWKPDAEKRQSARETPKARARSRGTRRGAKAAPKRPRRSMKRRRF